MSSKEVPIIVQGVNPGDAVAESIAQGATPSEQRRQPGRFLRKAKAVGFAGVATLAAVGGYEVYHAVVGGHAEHGYSATISAPTTKVYKNVSLQLATIDSTFRIKQETTLDRGDDSLIDWNPLNYDTVIDTSVTTEVNGGVRVGSLVATRNGKKLAVVIDGDLVFSKPAITHDRLDPEMADGLQLGVGTGEINKARRSANDLVKAAAGVATACAMQEDNVQALFGSGVVDFLATTSFTEGIDPANISVTIADIDRLADAEYGDAIAGLNATVSAIEKRYGSPEQTFGVNTRELQDCNKHQIEIVAPR